MKCLFSMRTRMNLELQKKLAEKYPSLFQDRKVDPAGMSSFDAFGIECGTGWYDLLDSVFLTLVMYEKHNNKAKYENIKLLQIKEKFGTLRIYYSGGDDFVDGITALAENMSIKICEECGKKGKMYSDGWITVRCTKHAP